MDTSKGYNRAAHKAATMTVVEEDYYEDLHDTDTGVEMFKVSEEERAAAAQAGESVAQQNGHEPTPQSRQQVGSDGGQEDKKPGLIGRLFGALRKLG